MNRLSALKKMPKASTIVFILVILSLIGVGCFALKDMFMTPAEKMDAAEEAFYAGNYKKAERYLLMANESEDILYSPMAAYYLGELYLKTGPNFQPDPLKSIMFFEQAALKDVPDAQYKLALLYDVGDKIPENRAKALAWMNEAAKHNYPDALYGLGVWLERGYMGEDIPMDKVVALYEKAASMGQTNAMSSLIAIYSAGFGGVPANPERTLYWMNQLTKIKEESKPKAGCPRMEDLAE